MASPPVAVCVVSMCVRPESGSMYCVIVRVIAAREMALRRNQPMPCFFGEKGGGVRDGRREGGGKRGREGGVGWTNQLEKGI